MRGGLTQGACAVTVASGVRASLGGLSLALPFPQQAIRCIVALSPGWQPASPWASERPRTNKMEEAGSPLPERSWAWFGGAGERREGPERSCG